MQRFAKEDEVPPPHHETARGGRGLPSSISQQMARRQGIIILEGRDWRLHCVGDNLALVFAGILQKQVYDTGKFAYSLCFRQVSLPFCIASSQSSDSAVTVRTQT